MSSGLIAVIVGAGIGLVIVIPVLWRYRVEIKRSWQEALGLTSGSSVKAREPSLEREKRDWLFSSKRRLAISLCLAASFGNAVLAVQTGDARLLYVFGVALFAVAAGLLTLTSRAQRD